MPSEQSSDVKFEIGHVLFIDIVGYSKLLINEQSEQIQKLKQIVRGTEQFRLAEAEGKLLRLATGDGGALVFRNSPEAPVLCAMEIAKALKDYPKLRVRMGIHSGPVNEITDLNEQANIAGAGINIAQRVMDCGDAGHILVSKRVADDLEQYPQWRPQLHDLGECEVKHGVRVSVVNLYTHELGNAEVPEKFKTAAGAKGPAVAGGRPLRNRRGRTSQRGVPTNSGKVDRGAAVRRYEPRQGPGIFLRWHRGGVAEPAGAASRSKSRGPHFGISVSRQESRHGRHRPATQGRARSRGQRTQEWRKS